MDAWAHLHDCWFEVDRVPQLLERVEHDDDQEAWKELGWRLVLENDLVSPAGFAALKPLVRLAPRSAEARALAGEILERAAGHHGCDDLLAECAGAIAEFREVLLRHLQSRPADFLMSLRAPLAAEEEYHWAAALGDFEDDFYDVTCPHCGVGVRIAIGNYGRYSAIQDWNLGDVERRDLRPVVSEELTGTGRWMFETAAQAGQKALAEGIAHLFGRAECPACASVFNVADEYTSANRPVMR
ncbi:hypothetical protein AB0M28_27915 [Streptomyces sp. NPDC051940]|uniref:hypothetical protein n=1 Tax=Streptomyces sp. NPDC051940 TaxID=3155675 RepID=UPI00343CDAF7